MKKQILVLMAALFFVFGGSLSAQTNKSYDSGKRTMDYFLSILDRIYVDTLDFDMLAEKGVKEMVTQLDPHSTYTTAKDVAASREPLKGSFDGIGVTIQIVKDTNNVVEVIIYGPSEKVGILPGDKIVKVDTLKACGKHINNNWVRDHLRGDRGTKVRLSIKRGHNPDLLEFTVTRGKIPMYSINVSFMIDEKTGYIKLDRFAQTSLSEFQQHFKKLDIVHPKAAVFGKLFFQSVAVAFMYSGHRPLSFLNGPVISRKQRSDPSWHRRSDRCRHAHRPGIHNSPVRLSWRRCPRKASAAGHTAKGRFSPLQP